MLRLLHAVEHELTVEQAFAAHNVKPDTGLSSAQVQELRAKHGWNRWVAASAKCHAVHSGLRC
jgi:hypothetical protein